VQQLQRHRAKVVLTSALYDDACLDFFVYSIAGFCRKVVNLQWEQVLTNEDESHPSFYQNPKGCARDAVHLCWGEETRNRLLRAGVNSEKALVVGPVQMDTLRPEFESVYLQKNELANKFNFDSEREWVLFISSFSFVNMSQDEYKLTAKALGDRIGDFRDISISSKKVVIEWLLLAVNKYPNKLFIYRPHPSENEDEELLRISLEYKNFRVVKELSIKQWIKCSDRVLTWYSTASAEVFFSNKKCLILRPISIPWGWEVATFNNASVISNVVDFLGSFENVEGEFPLDADVFDKYYMGRDGYPSYMRICDLLESVIKSEDFSMKGVGWFDLIRVRLVRFRNHFMFIVKKMLSKTNYKLFLFYSKPLILKFENHLAAMDRLKRNRLKNQASCDELDETYSKIQRIVNANLYR
jgi:hypothetical protein